MPSVKILSPAMATALEELGENKERGGERAGHKKKRCVRTEERTASQTTQVQGGHVPPKSSNIFTLDLDLCSPHIVGRTTEDVNPSFCSPWIQREQNGDSLFFLHESPHLKNGHDFRHSLSTTACCLFGRLARGCCVLCMCICSRAPWGPGGVTLSVKWPSTLPTYLSQDEAAASQWKIPIPKR
ncbi:unnamed protein product [Leuciscus chuanchicus]